MNVFDNCYLFDNIEYLNNAGGNNEISVQNKTLIEKDNYADTLKNYFMMKWFIENFKKDTDIVIIIGFAPGMSVYAILNEFLDTTFHLYDSANHFKEIENCKNAIIFNKYFEIADVEKYNSIKSILYSDIKTYDKNLNVSDDVQTQQMLVNALNPEVAMLRYSFKFIDTIVPLGIKIIQPFSSHTTEIKIVQFKNCYYYTSKNGGLANQTQQINKFNEFNKIRSISKISNNANTIDNDILYKMFGWSSTYSSMYVQNMKNTFLIYYKSFKNETRTKKRTYDSAFCTHSQHLK